MIKKLILCVIFLSLCMANELDDEFYIHKFLNNKNLGLSLCINEFYKDNGLPKAILNAPKAFLNVEFIIPENEKTILKFIRDNIENYIPLFKNPDFFKEYQPWYFVACLNMYNSKEYEDMINDLK